MTTYSSLFDRIRIKPECDEPAPARDEPACEHPGCARPGTYRAPRGRGQEGRYFQFCLDHVREYNASYNYFNGMDDAAVSAFQKEAVVGHRPTWSVSVNAAGRAQAARGDVRYDDQFDLLRRGKGPVRPAPEAPRRTLPPRVVKAFESLGLEPGADKAAVKQAYKTLVKRFHPDTNGGDRSTEARFHEVVKAYDALKAAKFA